MSLCDHIDTLAMAYLDDELATEERHELETHLTECASCRAELEAARGDHNLILGALIAPRASDTMRLRLVRTLDQADRDAARAERRRISSWVLPGGAIAAAAAAILVFVGVGAHTPTSVRGNSIARAAVHQQTRSLPFEVEGSRTGPWVQQQLGFELPQVSPTGSKVLGARMLPNGISGHDAWMVKYDVTVNGQRAILTVIAINDVKPEDMPDGDEVQAGDRTVHVVETDGHTMVTYLDAAHHGFVFSADELPTTELVKLVGRTGLVR